MKAPILEMRGLSIGYAGRKRSKHVVAGPLEAALRAGEFVCLLGPNGAGKSTLLQTLTGIRPPLCGSVLFDNRPIETFSARELAQRMSIVLTERVAAGMMPVDKLVALGRHPYTDWAGRLSPRDCEAVARAIEAAGVEPLSHRPFCELSDGEKQKVMIARALAQEPRVMILDEPTAFLDLPHRVELMHLLRRLARHSGRAVLMSTHELDLALRCADRLWLLPAGAPLLEGTPEDLVLRGAFSSVFTTALVSFDTNTGAFYTAVHARGAVSLSGEGIARIWTTRALERAGYQIVVPGQAKLSVEVATEGNGPCWRVSGKESRRCTSLGAVLETIAEEFGERQ
jgi:iron complex transport system ATP-binding protein